MKTVHVFLGADMRSMHRGLREIAKANGIDLTKLKKGEAAVFINASKNKLKSYSFNGVISYVRFDDPQRPIDLNALDELPKAFDPNGKLDYSRALKATLEKRLKSKGRFTTLSVL